MCGSDLWAGGNRRFRRGDSNGGLRGRGPVKDTSVANNGETWAAVFISRGWDVYLSVRRGIQRRTVREKKQNITNMQRVYGTEARNWMLGSRDAADDM